MKNFKKVIIGVCAATTLLASSVNTFADEVSAREEKDTYKVGFVSWNIGHTVPAAWDEGIQRQFASFPNIEYTAFDGEASTEKQVSIMNDLINQDYDIIMLQASDSAGLTSSVQEAEAAGIPVICINLDVNAPHAGLVEMATYESGALVAEKMGEQLGGKGNVVIIQGVIGASTQVLREQGAAAAQLAMFFINSGLDPQYITRTGVVDMAPTVVTADNVATILPEDRWLNKKIKEGDIITAGSEIPLSFTFLTGG